MNEWRLYLESAVENRLTLWVVPSSSGVGALLSRSVIRHKITWLESALGYYLWLTLWITHRINDGRGSDVEESIRDDAGGKESATHGTRKPVRIYKEIKWGTAGGGLYFWVWLFGFLVMTNLTVDNFNDKRSDSDEFNGKLAYDVICGILLIMHLLGSCALIMSTGS